MPISYKHEQIQLKVFFVFCRQLFLYFSFDTIVCLENIQLKKKKKLLKNKQKSLDDWELSDNSAKYLIQAT